MTVEAKNGGRVALSDLHALTPAEFEKTCVEQCSAGSRVSALLARQGSVLAVLANDKSGSLSFPVTRAEKGGGYPSLARKLPEAEAFERELLEETGVIPEGHPWLKPLRRQDPSAPRTFFVMGGEGVHEVAVGPVHAGIIEPGHFRFQCHGEEVLHLEIQLGYQHRGAEKLLLRSSPQRRIVVAESIAGDTAIGHGWAYCMAVESLCGTTSPTRAEAIRAVALELERLSNHVGDLGALCNDIGYLPGSAYFGRLRGEFLNLLMEISGNRFGRGLLIPGGVRFDLTDAMRGDAIKRLARAEKDLGQVAQMIFESNSIVTRFEKTGTVHNKTARELGLVGPSGRASGCDRDVRRDHPYGLYKEIPIPVAVRAEGDVMSRAVVRWLEIGHSLEFLKKVLDGLPRGPLAEAAGPMKPDALTVAMIEGWRGEIVHVAATDESGRLDTFKIVDPSFHNWFGLTMAIRANQISDFPLCNKSFNLSYAGHDL